jgi:hypothetical protein
MFVYYNPNPEKKNVGDCTIRALSKALGQSWEKTYIGVVLQGYQMGDMPSANHVWGAYLRKHGYRRNLAEEDTTVNSFADRNPEGPTFLPYLDMSFACRTAPFTILGIVEMKSFYIFGRKDNKNGLSILSKLSVSILSATCAGSSCAASWTTAVPSSYAGTTCSATGKHSRKWNYLGARGRRGKRVFSCTRRKPFADGQ